jgi:hypothetical protein
MQQYGMKSCHPPLSFTRWLQYRPRCWTWPEAGAVSSCWGLVRLWWRSEVGQGVAPWWCCCWDLSSLLGHLDWPDDILPGWAGSHMSGWGAGSLPLALWLRCASPQRWHSHQVAGQPCQQADPPPHAPLYNITSHFTHSIMQAEQTATLSWQRLRQPVPLFYVLLCWC